MHKKSELAAQQNECNTKMGYLLGDIKNDIDFLNDEIFKFQNSPGAVTPEDQTSLDVLEEKGKEIANKMMELYSLYPPVPPVTC
jgi:hypothetical protein